MYRALFCIVAVAQAACPDNDGGDAKFVSGKHSNGRVVGNGCHSGFKNLDTTNGGYTEIACLVDGDGDSKCKGAGPDAMYFAKLNCKGVASGKVILIGGPNAPNKCGGFQEIGTVAFSADGKSWKTGASWSCNQGWCRNEGQAHQISHDHSSEELIIDFPSYEVQYVGITFGSGNAYMNEIKVSAGTTIECNDRRHARSSSSSGVSFYNAAENNAGNSSNSNSNSNLLPEQQQQQRHQQQRVTRADSCPNNEFVDKSNDCDCATCDNIKCSANKFQSGKCSGSTNGFKCNDCTNQDCSQSRDTYRAGDCSGTTDGFECKDCDNTSCKDGEYQTGECSGTNNGFKCEDQTRCTAGEYLKDAGNRAKGVCAECPEGSFQTQKDHNYGYCTDHRECDKELEVETKKPSAVANTVCSRATECDYDAEFESKSKTKTEDRECTELSSCAPGSFVFKNSTKTSNILCSECDASKEWSGSTNQGKCTTKTACGPGQRLAALGSSTADATCAACEANTYQDQDSHMDATCTPQDVCSAGEYLFDSEPPPLEDCPPSRKPELRCCNGDCQRAAWANDGTDDCGDGSDENGKCGFGPNLGPTARALVCTACPDGQFNNQETNQSPACTQVSPATCGIDEWVQQATNSTDETCAPCIEGTSQPLQSHTMGELGCMRISTTATTSTGTTKTITTVATTVTRTTKTETTQTVTTKTVTGTTKTQTTTTASTTTAKTTTTTMATAPTTTKNPFKATTITTANAGGGVPDANNAANEGDGGAADAAASAAADMASAMDAAYGQDANSSGNTTTAVIIGVVLVLLVVAGAAFYVLKSGERAQQEVPVSFENPMYDQVHNGGGGGGTMPGDGGAYADPVGSFGDNGGAFDGSSTGGYMDISGASTGGGATSGNIDGGNTGQSPRLEQFDNGFDDGSSGDEDV